jgi:ABC-2 type transport system ATP-binding protein
VISTTGLSRAYDGTLALDDVDLAVPDGAVYGLVGPNGAGKTTLLGILAGLRRPTSGEVHVAASPGEVAVLPDTPRFDAWLSGHEVVSLAQRLVEPGATPERVDEVLAEAGLADAAHRRVGGYSRGMLQRLGVACTIVGRPRLVLLDEPASALDPQGRREVLDLIARLRGSATVLFSSHILVDVQEVCDTVGILDRGRLLFQGDLSALLTGAAVPRWLVRLRAPVAPVAEHLAAADWVEDVEALDATRLAVRVRSVEEAEGRLPAALAAAGARVVAIGPEEVSLERAFLALTGGER